jgi:hypothetical protein
VAEFGLRPGCDSKKKTSHPSASTFPFPQRTRHARTGRDRETVATGQGPGQQPAARLPDAPPPPLVSALFSAGQLRPHPVLPPAVERSMLARHTTRRRAAVRFATTYKKKLHSRHGPDGRTQPLSSCTTKMTTTTTCEASSATRSTLGRWSVHKCKSADRGKRILRLLRRKKYLREL